MVPHPFSHCGTSCDYQLGCFPRCGLGKPDRLVWSLFFFFAFATWHFRPLLGQEAPEKTAARTLDTTIIRFHENRIEENRFQRFAFEQNIKAHWGNSTGYGNRQWIRTLPKDTDLLELEDSGSTDADMAFVAELENLKKLGLGGTAISDAGLKKLRDLTQLTKLSLRASRIRDSRNAEILSQLTELQDQGLRPLITDDGLRELRSLKQLEWLDLADTQITDSGMQIIQGMTNLEELCLANTAVTSVGLRELLGLQHLRNLDLWQTRVDDSILLDLLTDAGLQHLEGLQSLKSFGLAHTKVTNEGIKKLSGLAQLEIVNLVGTNLTDVGLLELKPLTRLRTVYVDAPITLAGVQRAQEQMPHCKFLFPRQMNTGR